MNWSWTILLFKYCKSRFWNWTWIIRLLSLFLQFLCFFLIWLLIFLWFNHTFSFKLFLIQSLLKSSIFPKTFFQCLASLTIKSPKTTLFAIRPKPIVKIFICKNKFSFPLFTTIYILSLILRTIFPNKPSSTVHHPISPITLIRVLFIIILKAYFSLAIRD